MHDDGNSLRSSAALEAYVREGAGAGLDIAAELRVILLVAFGVFAVLGVLGVLPFIADAAHQDRQSHHAFLARLQRQGLACVDH